MLVSCMWAVREWPRVSLESGNDADEARYVHVNLSRLARSMSHDWLMTHDWA
jgi:hypothetical protein